MNGTCKLSLTINRVNYVVRPLKDRLRNELGGWTLTRKNEDGTKTAYEVIKDRWGTVRCSCPDDISRRHPVGECKHAKSLRACGLIGASFRATGRTKESSQCLI